MPGLTRQSILFAKKFYEEDGPRGRPPDENYEYILNFSIDYNTKLM